MNAPDLAPTPTEAVLLQALEVARGHGHHTLTFRAALSVANFAARQVEHRPLSGQELSEGLDQLAELLRDIIRADPDHAAPAIGALRELNSAIREVGNPRRWQPTDAQVARAAQVLGVQPDEVRDTAFAENGAFYARELGGSFTEIPPLAVEAAEEREDV